MNNKSYNLTEERLTDIQGIIERITKNSREPENKYIFRGEAKIYPKVCSGLYRDYINIDENPNFDEIHDLIVEKYHEYLPSKNGMPDEIIAELQHYGAKTNLIDFTPDYLIALFFACDIDHEQDGRIIILKNMDNEEYHVITPHDVVDRIVHQKSRFVLSSRGFLDTETYQQIRIPGELKPYILAYLERYHAITTDYIYNDIHGFMKIPDIQNYYILFEKGIEEENTQLEKKVEERDFSAAINYFECAKSLNPYFYRAYTSLIQIYLLKHEYSKCIDYCDEAIELDLPSAQFYSKKATALYYKKEYQEAVECHDMSIQLDDRKPDYHLERCKCFIKLVDTYDEISSDDEGKIISYLQRLHSEDPEKKNYLIQIDNFVKDEDLDLTEKVGSELANLLSSV